jgi:quercetin dioxygenase-like cupin family protein
MPISKISLAAHLNVGVAWSHGVESRKALEADLPPVPSAHRQGRVQASVVVLEPGRPVRFERRVAPTFAIAVAGDFTVDGSSTRSMLLPVGKPVVLEATAWAKVLFVRLGPSSGKESALPGRRVLDAVRTRTGERVDYPAGANLATVAYIDIAPGAAIPRHTHPASLFAFVAQGDLRLTTPGKATRTFHMGDSFMESTLPHSGRNTGDATTRLIAVYFGRKGDPLSVVSR